MKGFTRIALLLLGWAAMFSAPAAEPPTLTNVSASATSVTLMAANSTNWRARLVFNDATTALYLKYGATASTSSFTVKILPGGYWEMPPVIYAGRIDGIWDGSPTGTARITEY